MGLLVDARMAFAERAGQRFEQLWFAFLSGEIDPRHVIPLVNDDQALLAYLWKKVGQEKARLCAQAVLDEDDGA